ncbi:MAG: transcriptional repressor [Clostridia bacterium]|nr:transcriptional repressor [Clostridia bacterium]
MKEVKYKTKQKEEILQYLIKNSNNFVSAEDIEKYFKDENITVGLTTIYRFLNLLEKQGKLRIEARKNTKYYQYISKECDQHFHLKCEKCGKLIHFDCEELEKLNSHISKEHNFSIDSKTLIYGVCEDCKKGKNI